MISITLADLQEWGACNLADRAAALRTHLDRDVPLDEPIPLAVWADVPHDGADHTCDRDLRWVLSRTSEGRRILAALAADYAEMAMPIWQRSYPDDTRPADCIAAVRAWLADPSPKRRSAMRAARPGALDAWLVAIVDAADAAKAAAAAADAAASAADRAAATTDAAADAGADAYAADAYAADADAAADAAAIAAHRAAATTDAAADAGADAYAADARMRARQRDRLLQYLRGEVAP